MSLPAVKGAEFSSLETEGSDYLQTSYNSQQSGSFPFPQSVHCLKPDFRDIPFLHMDKGSALALY